MSEARKRVSRRSSVGKARPLAFDKYAIYRRAVQSPENDVEFLRDTYKELKGRLPQTLREDFCGTFSICCEWLKLGPKYRAHGVDLDYDPIHYGLSHYVPQLSRSQRERLEVHQENVLSPDLPHVDLICAMNFSYYIFKEREALKAYFKNCYKTLKEGGILVTDCFGGSLCQEANEEKTKLRGFTYYWDQESFDPVTNHAVFHIHFKLDGKKKVENVFSYDWRMWTIPEIRELMLECGFRNTHVYWEGTTKSGGGNGEFRRVDKGEECQAWIAYVVAEK
jgi:SAM-dependent methyltransferase